MKLLVFAHVPPPHHGQSYMVQLMLEGFGGDWRQGPRPAQGPAAAYGIQCYHVDARLSRQLEDIGDIRFSKFLLLIGYCLQAIWCRFRYGVTTLYYVPAPGKRSALFRDWLVMFLCRPFYKRIILHWHAAGLARWLEIVAQSQSRSLTYRLMKRVDLSIVLSRYNQGDAEKLFSRRITVVGNGIPDPCPAFASEVLPRRKARFAARAKLLAGNKLSPEEITASGGDAHTFRVLFLAHCTREKGLFDAIDGVALANRALAEAGSPISLELTVAGDFINSRERQEFDERLAQPDLQARVSSAHPHSASSVVHHIGFVFGETKKRALADADCFCFPTYYYAENFPLVLTEAMAAGLLLITTRWRSIPELLPDDYPGLVEVRTPAQIAERLQLLMNLDMADILRARFAQRFAIEGHLTGLAAAFHALEAPASTPPTASSQACGSSAV